MAKHDTHCFSSAEPFSRVAEQKAFAHHRPMKSTPETVGERIVRLAAGLPSPPTSRKALAAALGVEYETLRKWCAGLSAPNRSRAEHVARYLGVTESVVMHGVSVLSDSGMSPATTLDTALEIVAAAIGATPAADRQELGDLMRQWAVYGGKDLYRELIAELMQRGAGAPIAAIARAVSPEAMRVARAYDAAPASVRAAVYAMAQQGSMPDASPAPADRPEHTTG
jgi:transcriptional regulator with XRE-family HTH domain